MRPYAPTFAPEPYRVDFDLDRDCFTAGTLGCQSPEFRTYEEAVAWALGHQAAVIAFERLAFAPAVRSQGE